MRTSIFLAGLAVSLRLVGAEHLLSSWNNALLDSVRAENVAPCLTARNLAIVHGAVYDACVNVTGREQPFLFRTQVKTNASVEASANAAAFLAACYVSPSRKGSFENLYQRHRASMPNEVASEEGDRIGRKAAQAWIDWRSTDGIGRSLPYIPKTEAGAWRRTPPFFRPPDLPAWCLVEPFTLVGSAQFRPPGPPGLGTSRYAEELNRVKVLGGAKSSERTAEQTQTARFWSDFSYSVTPPGHWNQIAQEVCSSRGFDLSSASRVFAVLNITLADVGIACWEAKFHYNFWRPVTAIQKADIDGNDATEKDAQWISLLTTPAFPEYISGHSAFSGAGAAILSALIGTDSIDFSVPSDTLPGQTRSFHSLRQCAEEISQSRLYGGIHFPSALEDGLALGQKVAGHVLDCFQAPGRTPKVLFTAPAEIDGGKWIGTFSIPGAVAVVERLEQGRWQSWTNLPAIGRVIRWKADDSLAVQDFRIVRN